MFKLGLIFDITIKKIKFIPWLGINTNLILAEASVRKYKCLLKKISLTQIICFIYLDQRDQ